MLLALLIYAYVTLNSGVEPSDELTKELVAWVRKDIGPIASPDWLQWAPGLPKTRSGKIMRRTCGETERAVPMGAALFVRVTGEEGIALTRFSWIRLPRLLSHSLLILLNLLFVHWTCLAIARRHIYRSEAC